MVAVPFGDWPTAFVAALAVSKTKIKNEAKFDQMVESLSLSPAAIVCIDDPRTRVLFRGVEAGCRNAEIRTAFRIVYRDLAPIRVAGDLLFGQLVSVADRAAERGNAIAVVADEDEADEAETLAATRRLFDLLDGDGSGGLDRAELLASPALLELVRSGVDAEIGAAEEAGSGRRADDDAAVDRFLALADENGDGIVSFVEFANAAAAQPQLRIADDALAAAFADGESRARRSTEPKTKKRSFGRKPPGERFDEMLRQCLEWEERLGCVPSEGEVAVLANEGDLTECTIDVNLEQRQAVADDDDGDDEESRLLQVLKGALVGARCDPLVEALKMCYLDYSPLRLGGDVIFKLLGRVVQTQLSANE